MWDHRRDLESTRVSPFCKIKIGQQVALYQLHCLHYLYYREYNLTTYFLSVLGKKKCILIRRSYTWTVTSLYLLPSSCSCYHLFCDRHFVKNVTHILHVNKIVPKQFDVCTPGIFDDIQCIYPCGLVLIELACPWMIVI